MEVVCYLSNGYPTIADSRNKVDTYYKAGCRMIEMDLPSPDPYLEGELIGGRMKSALAVTSDYKFYLENIADVRKAYPDMKVLLLAYEDTMLAVGIENLKDFCLEHDVNDVIVVGDKYPRLKEELMSAGMQVSCYIRYNLPEGDITNARNSNGFIYLQAKPIGSPVNPDFPTLKDLIDELRHLGFNRAIYCGVGVHDPKDVVMVRNAGADAAFVGSSILRVDNNPEKLQEVIETFVAASKA